MAELAAHFAPLQKDHKPDTRSIHGTEAFYGIKSYAQIAQLVEQRTENPRVAGSIPALGIFVARSNEIIE